MNLKAALLAVLVGFVGVFFTSCDKNDHLLNPVSVKSGKQIATPSSDISELRVTRATYSVQQRYKTSYEHESPGRHDIASGFVSWFNCIARAHGTPLLTVDGVFQKCDVTPPRYDLTLERLKREYSPIYLLGYTNLEGEAPDSAANRFLNDMRYYLDGGRPWAVLIRNNYSGRWRNVLVVVMSYDNGSIVYEDPKISQQGTMDFATFIELAKQASSSGKTINVIRI